jgi:hypothetical protein
MHFVLMFIVRNVEQLEHNPRSQYAFNRLFAVFWFILGIIVICVPKLYAHNLADLIIAEATVWGCFATHFGAMSSALAAIGTRKQQTTALQNEPAVIHPDTPLPEWGKV